MASGVAQIDKAAFGQQQQVIGLVFLWIRTVDLVHLRLDLFPGPVLAHERSVDLVVEVTDVADHCAGLHSLQHVLVADIDVAGGGHDHIKLAQQCAVDVFDAAGVVAVEVRRHDFITVHTRLHRADRIDLGDLYDHAFLTQTLCRTLAHIAVSDDERMTARQ